MARQLDFLFDPLSSETIKDPKEYFFNLVSASLLQETKYYASSNDTRDEIFLTMEQVSQIDSEFILQTAYYVRNRMYIRTTSNFILAYSILNPRTAKFVPKYFNKIVLIPGDLIEVCQFVQVIYLLNLKKPLGEVQDPRKKFYFPNLLKKCVASKLLEFSMYQVGKQCSESSRKKTLIQYKEFLHPEIAEAKKSKKLAKLLAIRNLITQNADQDVIEQVQQQVTQRTGMAQKFSKKHKPIQSEVKNIFDIKFITMKDIIRFCHVTHPKEIVMSIMGKRYPNTEDSFKSTYKLEDESQSHKFVKENAGKRMTIPIPVTWDRELSRPNVKKQEVWSELIIKNQVPYMALMRNLRNILKANISTELLVNVMDRIQNPKFVETAKMFPLQYINALVVLDKVNQDDILRPPKEIAVQSEQIKVDPKMVEAFKTAIEQAIRISIDKNLDKIVGTTYVFCDVSGSMSSRISGGKKYGSVSSCEDCGFLLGLMIKSKSEKCEFYLFSSGDGQNHSIYEKIDVDTENILESFKRCQEVSKTMGKSAEMIGQTINDILLVPKIKASNVIILSDMMVTQGFQGDKISFESVIKQYIMNVNPKVKFFFMDISGQGRQVTYGKELKGKNCFNITGMSDQVLKYIALAGMTNQIEDVKAFAEQVKGGQEQHKKAPLDQLQQQQDDQ